MSAKINHVAIATDHYAINARFYQALFGMNTSSKPRPARVVAVADGYVGLNNVPRREGRCSGLDHFGIEVDDIEDTIARIHKFDPTLEALKRPPVRPFAAYSTHDPDCNIFDLSQRDIGLQKDVFAELDGETRPRHINHIAIRTRHVEKCAEFYVEVFGLAPRNRQDENFYLSDGRVTLMIMPWKMSDYYGQDPARPGLEHIGLKVESVEQVKKDMESLIGENPHLHGRPLGLWLGRRVAAKAFPEMSARLFPPDRHRRGPYRRR